MLIEPEIDQLDETVSLGAQLEGLSRLAGGIAHDFNNLLTMIANFSAFAAEGVDAAIQGGDAAYLTSAANDIRQIQLAASRAMVRTRQLLAFAGCARVRAESLDINTLVNAVVAEVYRNDVGAVTVQRRLAVGLPAIVADAAQLHRAILDLVQNASEAMPSGGTLLLTTDLVSRDGVSGVELRVVDTGVGMDAEVLEHAFEPYFTTKDFGQGAGLGLATVYGMVRQAGGTIHVASTPGAGTSVAVWLPARCLRLANER